MTPEKLVQSTLRDWIYKQDNIDRIRNYELMERYYDGTFADDDLPAYLKGPQIMSPRLREALNSDLKVISNYAKTVVNKAVGYLCSKPISIEVSPDLFGLGGEEQTKQRERVKAAAQEAERFLYQVYKNNKFLHKNIIKLMRLQGKKGDVFVKCWIDRTDKERPIKMQVLRPDYVFIKFRSDNYEDKEYIAIIYNKYDEQGNPYKFAQVWWPDAWREYEMRTTGGDWTETAGGANEIDRIPIVHIKNMEDEKPWGESDIEVIRTLVDASCKALTDLMVNADYQAFQRVIVSGFTPMSGEKRQEETGPGTVKYIPAGDAGQNPEVTVVEPSDPGGLIKIIDALAQEISTHARVPKIALSRADGAGAASSLSLRIHYQPLDEKCSEKAALAAEGLQEINKIIFAYHKLLTRDDFTGFETEIRFSKSLPLDKKEEAEIRDMAIKNKTLSRETAMAEAGVDDPTTEMEQIRQEAQEAQEDLYGRRLDMELERIAAGTSAQGR